MNSRTLFTILAFALTLSGSLLHPSQALALGKGFAPGTMREELDAQFADDDCDCECDANADTPNGSLMSLIRLTATGNRHRHAGKDQPRIPVSPTPNDCQTTPGSSMTHATWYGKGFQGQQTSSGQIFNTDDRSQLTAAHRTLPLGSLVRVRNLETNQIVVVRITDRTNKRIHNLDLSRAAAKKVGIFDPATGTGSGAVEIKRCLDPGTTVAGQPAAK